MIESVTRPVKTNKKKMMCNVGSVGYPGWGVRDVGCSGCAMFRMWDVRDVGCSECRMLGMWDVRYVGCSGCAMFGMWDVRDGGCLGCLLGCGMLIYKML